MVSALRSWLAPAAVFHALRSDSNKNTVGQLQRLASNSTVDCRAYGLGLSYDKKKLTPDANRGCPNAMVEEKRGRARRIRSEHPSVHYVYSRAIFFLCQLHAARSHILSLLWKFCIIFVFPGEIIPYLGPLLTKQFSCAVHERFDVAGATYQQQLNNRSTKRI